MSCIESAEQVKMLDVLLENEQVQVVLKPYEAEEKEKKKEKKTEKNEFDVSGCMIFTSGRISGDYLEKVIYAGGKIIISRTIVTSQAVKQARENKITMMGFVRKNTANIFQWRKCTGKIRKRPKNFTIVRVLLR